MNNPFLENKEEDQHDTDCILKAISGDREALEQLILRHQSWIYNIALAMTGGDIELAEDVTQEVLIKVITKLSQYDPRKASFRTWLYRIVANYILSLNASPKEKFFSSMKLESGSDLLIVQHPDSRKSMRPGHAIDLEEIKISCISCTLLCLTRRERMISVLGVIFNVPDSAGAEICAVSRTNYRKILSRSRAKLNMFFTTNCSLLDEKNPCTCARYSELLRNSDSGNRKKYSDQISTGSIREALGEVINEIEDSYYEFISLFRDQPFFKGPDMVKWLNEMFSRTEFKGIFSEYNEGILQ